MSEQPAAALRPEDHALAFTEVSFLLDIFATTVDELMGGATASVGRVAGRHMARKLPLWMADPDVYEAMAALAQYGQLGVRPVPAPERGAVDFPECAVRQVCAARGQAPGGKLCRLFHYYLDGVVDQLVGRPVRSEITCAGESMCTVEVTVR